MPSRGQKRVRVTVEGIVQGVGFRPFVKRAAVDCSLTGWVLNRAGCVEIEAQGPAVKCDQFIHRIILKPPPGAVVRGMSCKRRPPHPAPSPGFAILPSEKGLSGPLFISPDIGICAQCADDLRDPNNRRFRYPFTNCAHCGPRFTIMKKLPYDRERTTMRLFSMCLDCGFEYHDQSDRRFHAEPNACAVCGPQYTYLESGDFVVGNGAVDGAVRALSRGGIVAVKGVGGFHLTCLAYDKLSVERVRAVKGRDAKPLAVMAADLGQAAQFALISPRGRKLLTGSARPIVILPVRPGSRLSAGVSGSLATVGVILPYAPIHHLLLEGVGEPLVMTSANRKDEPIVFENTAAQKSLTSTTDGCLMHDRDIIDGCDDPVVRAGRRRTVIVRAGRGLAPRSFALGGAYRPLLACGADLKAGVCFARDGWAHTSHYLGDLINPKNLGRYRTAVGRLSRLFAVAPEHVVCDLHPDYISTVFAQHLGLPVKGTQHHHAHIAAVMVEKGLENSVIGVAFDGTGWGTDNTIWGGEWLICRRDRFERAGSLLPVCLPGGEAAVRRPWRTAASHLFSLGLTSAEAHAFLPRVDPEDLTAIERQVAAGINAPLTSSCGRLFDAAAALILGVDAQTYDGEAASLLESAAAGADAACGAYKSALTEGPSGLLVDHAPMWEGVLADLAAREAPEIMAGRFHNWLAAVTGSFCARLRKERGLTEVVLSGGVFVNENLLTTLVGILEGEGFVVHTPVDAAINDGGISLGQAGIVAAGGGVNLETAGDHESVVFGAEDVSRSAWKSSQH